jgi:hypothetical protein
MLTLTSRETKVVLLALGELKKKQIENLPIKPQEIQNIHARAFDLIYKAPSPCGVKQGEKEFL